MLDFSKNKKIQNLLRRFPVMLEYRNERHILAFRRILERSLKYGYWNGKMAELS